MPSFHSLPLLSLSAIGTVLTFNTAVHAAPAETAPAELLVVLEQVELAANERDIDAVMALYAANFENSDGFTYETLEATLPQLWERYDSLQYRIELQSWEDADGSYVAETVTYIDGIQEEPRDLVLESVIRSRQRLNDGKIVFQEVLSERNQLSSGLDSPDVFVILPERVAPGESYGFDAIVQEPLGDRYLLGAALDEGTTPEDFFTPRPLDLELLSAGGLFKQGVAPDQADNLWISGLLIRNDALVVITRRLRVE